MNTIRTCVLLLCLFVGSVSSVQRLNNIDDLRNTHYSKREPNHGLKLLFWFAQHVIDIDENYTSQMDIEPSRGDYGFHWFENRERILPTLSSEIKGYYSVGNLRYPRATELPAYVRKDHYISPHSPDSNLDRLIVCVNRRDPTRLHSVFITSLIYQLDELDPHLTFEINPALIHQIQCPCNCTSHHYNDYLFSTLTSNRKDINDVQKTLQTAKIIFKEPGLSAFLTLTEYDIKYSYRSFAVRYHCLATSSAKELSEPSTQCHITAEIKLEIKTSATGLAKLTWEHIPANVMKEYVFIYVAVCKNTDFSNAHKYHECPKFGVKSSSGSVDTSVYLNFGLQPRLLLYKLVPEVTNGNRGMPTKIKPYRASLQLYTENGKACAQLYIKKTFSDWKNVFSYSWVGFYKNSQEANDQYYTSIYVVNMEKVEKYSTGEYYVYKYQSSLDIAPGVQIRFLLENKYDDRNVLARTQPWKDTKYPVTLQTNNDDLHPGLLPELLPHLSNPESFHGSEFDEANGIIPIRILGFDASLQLYANDGKACARLYIKKTFCDWKDVFSYSWVGFYKNSQEANDQYYTSIYVVEMEKVEKYSTGEYYVYKYQSSLDIAPGVQIRFLLENKYDDRNVLARTQPWKDTKYPITLQTNNDDLHPGLPPELLPHLSNPESFHGPEFDEANGIIPIRILGSDASLQLYANDGKACARLYIKKTFSDWKNVFSYSWVGFYKNSQEANDQYYTYIYVVKMEKMGNDNIMDYDIYQYKSSLDIAPEVQIRFLLDETYDNMLAQTEPWEGANISQITISCFQS